MINRNMLKDHLRQGQAHVRQGAEHIGRQRAVIANLDAGGHDTEAARRLLKVFEETQAMHVADVARLEGELARP